MCRHAAVPGQPSLSLRQVESSPPSLVVHSMYRKKLMGLRASVTGTATKYSMPLNTPYPASSLHTSSIVLQIRSPPPSCQPFDMPDPSAPFRLDWTAPPSPFFNRTGTRFLISPEQKCMLIRQLLRTGRQVSKGSVLCSSARVCKPSFFSFFPLLILIHMIHGGE